MDNQSKRPYERPRLEATEVFGTDAASGSCCRTTFGTCTASARDAQRTTIDPNKKRISSTS